METIIDKKKHRIVYIEYQGGLPHSVITTHFIEGADTPYWRAVYWDFFPNNGDKKDIRAYESGSGGSHKKIQAPHWAEGHSGQYWIDADARFKGNPINGKQVPLKRIKGYYGNTSQNPFKVAEITFSHEYCDKCGHESTEFCDTHKYTDDNGNDRWKDTNEIAE